MAKVGIYCVCTWQELHEESLVTSLKSDKIQDLGMYLPKLANEYSYDAYYHTFASMG